MHGAGGNILFLWSLARAMAGSRPIYGFQARGVDGTDMPDATIEEMAARYVRELRAEHDGPYILGGYSGGGIVTFEMVRQLQEMGAEVRVHGAVRQRAPGMCQPVTQGSVPQPVRATSVVTASNHSGRTSATRIRGPIRRVIPRTNWRSEQARGQTSATSASVMSRSSVS